MKMKILKFSVTKKNPQCINIKSAKTVVVTIYTPSICICIVSFMPQYYFSVKLIAKKRQVNIRQQIIKKYAILLTPATGVKSKHYKLLIVINSEF